MKKIYKLLSLALAVLLCGVCLSACGSAEPAQTTTTATTTAATTTTVTVESEPAMELTLERFRYSSGPISVDYIYQFDYLEWGSSLDDVSLEGGVPLERNTDRDPADNPAVEVYTCTVPVMLDGQETSMHFTFENDGLTLIELSFEPGDDGEWFTAQLEKLVELYGESLADTGDLGETHRWRTDISQLQLTLLSGQNNDVLITVGSLPPAPEATLTAADFGNEDGYLFRGIDWFGSIEDAQAVLPFTFYRNPTFEPEDDPTIAAYSSQTPVTLDDLEGDFRLIYENEELVLAEFAFRPDDAAWFDVQLDAFTELYGEGEVSEFDQGKQCIWRNDQSQLELALFEGSRWTSVTIKLGPLEE